MVTATYTGNKEQSDKIDLGHNRKLVFPKGKAIEVTDEVAQVLVNDKKQAKVFKVIDKDGKPVKPLPEEKVKS